ncbi:MAG: ABC transporter permease subunit [Rhizobiales bacterium]|nr:ABC transporter permease subunit [Hyphomicrobiales bacterium]
MRRLFDNLRLLRTSLPPIRGLLPLVLLLVIWQMLQSGPSPYFPAPDQWWMAGLRLFHRNDLIGAFEATTLTFLGGLLLAILIGTAVGILIGVSAFAACALGPLLEFMRAIPPPATVPVFVLLIGYNETMKLTVVTLSALWPILLNTTAAARGIDPLLLDVARSFRLTTWDRIRRIIAPAVIPALLLGIRVALPLAIVVALLVEMLTSLPGIGAMMIRSQRNFQSAEVYALLVLVGLFGFVVNDVFAVIESIILRRWPPRTATTS